ELLTLTQPRATDESSTPAQNRGGMILKPPVSAIHPVSELQWLCYTNVSVHLTYAMSYLDEIKHLEESDKKFIWHPFTQMKGWLEEEPIIIAEGRDCFVKDVYGKWYLDGVSSLWVSILGHRKQEIDDAIRAQVDKIAHSTLLGLSNIPAIQLAEKLIGLTDRSFAGLERRLTKVF